MPWSTSFAGLSARALGWASSVIANIYDNFARVTSGSLGTATSGQIWTAVNGVWYANNGVAQTASSPSIYPSAQFAVAENANVSVVSPSPGAGIMVWQTDSGDWWGATTYVTESSTPVTQCQDNSCCTGSATSPNTCDYFTYTNAAADNCLEAGGNPGSYTTGCDGSAGTCRFTTRSANAACCGTSNTCVSNPCCTYIVTGTTYVWTQFLTIIKSVASAVSTVGTTGNIAPSSQTNQTGIYPGSAVNSLSVTTLGDTITARAYSDTGFSTLIGTLSENNPSPAGTGVGILLAPSSDYQGTTVGPFSAN